jgi:hypothetical protein
MVAAELLAFGGVAAPLHVAEAPRADVERALTRALA